MWVWCSFCDPKKPEGFQFLGAAIVRGDNVAEGAQEAWRLGINPGGEVLGIPLPQFIEVAPEYRERLLDDLEAKELSEAINRATAN